LILLSMNAFVFATMGAIGDWTNLESSNRKGCVYAQNKLRGRDEHGPLRTHGYRLVVYKGV
jgi:hypothetical protein